MELYSNFQKSFYIFKNKNNSNSFRRIRFDSRHLKKFLQVSVPKRMIVSLQERDLNKFMHLFSLFFAYIVGNISPNEALLDCENGEMLLRRWSELLELYDKSKLESIGVAISRWIMFNNDEWAPNE